MLLNNNYKKLFGDIPIFGMIHLAGQHPVKRALEEIEIYENEGLDAAIIENYHGSVYDVVDTLKEICIRKNRLSIGINILPNEFKESLSLAEKYEADFVQLDHIAGTYMQGELNFRDYKKTKKRFYEKIVLGGVWPKYYFPLKGSDLEEDLKLGMKRAEAIVVTGEGTGKETPIDKIRKFRDIIGTHPLVVGAGLNLDNAYEQLILSDGAIVGTSLKIEDNTQNPIDKFKVRGLMDIVRQAREYKSI